MFRFKSSLSSVNQTLHIPSFPATLFLPNIHQQCHNSGNNYPKTAKISHRHFSSTHFHKQSFFPSSQLQHTTDRLSEKFLKYPNSRYIQAQYLRHLLDTSQPQKVIHLFDKPGTNVMRNEENSQIYREALQMVAQDMRHSSASSSSYSPPPIHIYNNHIIPSHALPGVHGGASENGHSSTYVTREDLSKFQNDLYTGISGAQYKTKTEKLSIFRKIFILLTTALGAFAVYIYYNGIPPSLNKYIKVTVKKSGSGPPTPSSMIGGNKQVGQVIQNTGKYFDDVKGIDECKEELVDIVDFLKHPEKYEKFGARIPRGVLLVGPPGTGKTLLAKAVAQEAGVQFVSACGSEFDQAFVGMGASRVRDLFKMIPPGEKGVIFIDEIDSMCGSRSDSDNDATRRIKTQFLVQMQGVGNDTNGVLVLAATNIPWGLDSAIRRRFERRIYIPLPDQRARVVLFELCVGDTPHELTKKDYHELAAKTDGYSGSDISILVRNALMEPVRTCQIATHFKRVSGEDPNHAGVMRDDLLTPCSPGDPQATPMTLAAVPPQQLLPPKVTKKDFLKAFRVARPSVNKEDLGAFVDFTRDFGQES
uniref:AAA+ ATPase domain-containing protein n=1 Tax=Percolomonas cosmopolitus TaxID=63605 RepID=A0A7S1KRS6_9EUKA|mmetsp:Transcript_5922/g.22447  ORF Transcript_5922/g.22447 Transcript_5922/m.22447 type:complete len:589 (+) Transcript_5922:207-1973(+)